MHEKNCSSVLKETWDRKRIGKDMDLGSTGTFESTKPHRIDNVLQTAKTSKIEYWRRSI